MTLLTQEKLDGTIQLYGYFNIDREIWDLAKHHDKIVNLRIHDEIRERKFPGMLRNYRCILTTTPGHGQKCDALIRFYRISGGDLVILSASFASSSVKIASRFDHEGLWPDPYKIIYYADPKFTDEIVYDVLIGMGIGNLSRLKT